MRRLGLRARFILLILVLFVVLFATATTILIQRNTHTLRQNLNEQAWSFANLATKPIGDTFVLYKDSGRIRIAQQVTKFTDLDPDISNVVVTDTQGKVLFNKTGAAPTHLNSDIASTFTAKVYKSPRGEAEQIVAPFIEDFGVHRYSVMYSVSNERINRNITQVVATIVTFSAIILLLMVVVTYMLINRIFLKPVKAMSEEALLISAGDFNRQIKLKRNDEIGDLANAVNNMANALKADITKLQEVDRLKSEFMMITSHNLRTPLTIMNGYLEMVQTHGQLDQEQSEAFEAITANVRRLGTLTEGILTISTIEAGGNIINLEPAKLRPIIEQIADEFKPMAAQKKLSFHTEINLNDEEVNLSKQHLRSAVWNLLDNASKFTSEGGSVTLAAQRYGRQIAVSVQDTGTGVATEEIPKLFTKFHRGTSTLTYNYEGAGIGLYVTKLITEQHGGSVKVVSEPDKGSTFTILLPIAPLEPAPTGEQKNL